MSLSSQNMLKLMAYADGELESAELVEAQKLLATEPDAVRFVEQVGGLGELVVLGHEARSAKTIAAFDVTDAVMALTKDAVQDVQDEVPAGKVAAPAAGGNVRSLDAARALREARDKRAPAGGSRLKIGAGIAAALALAASIAVFSQHRGAEETPMAKGPAIVAPEVQAPGAGAAVAPSGVASNGVAANIGAGIGVEVSTLEAAGSSVSVFYLPSANELTTSVVVWVDETGEK